MVGSPYQLVIARFLPSTVSYIFGKDVAGRHYTGDRWICRCMIFDIIFIVLSSFNTWTLLKQSINILQNIQYSFHLFMYILSLINKFQAYKGHPNQQTLSNTQPVGWRWSPRRAFLSTASPTGPASSGAKLYHVRPFFLLCVGRGY